MAGCDPALHEVDQFLRDRIGELETRLCDSLVAYGETVLGRPLKAEEVTPALLERLQWVVIVAVLNSDRPDLAEQWLSAFSVSYTALNGYS